MRRIIRSIHPLVSDGSLNNIFSVSPPVMNVFLYCRPVLTEADVGLFYQGENEGGLHLLAVIDADAHLG